MDVESRIDCLLYPLQEAEEFLVPVTGEAVVKHFSGRGTPGGISYYPAHSQAVHPGCAYDVRQRVGAARRA